jgi:hypothetical protein
MELREKEFRNQITPTEDEMEEDRREDDLEAQVIIINTILYNLREPY